ALYRLAALAALRRHLDFGDARALAEAAAGLNVQFTPVAAGERVLLDGVDVTTELRTEQAGDAASKVAAIPEVRTALLKRQRNFAVPPGLVADGRDMGTVVFPNAL